MFEEHSSAFSGSDNSPQPVSEIPSSAVLFSIDFLCHFSTVLLLLQRRGPCQWNIGPSGDWWWSASQSSKHVWNPEKPNATHIQTLDVGSIRFVFWSRGETDRLFFFWRKCGGRATRQERVPISIWSSTGEAVTALACQEACGELGWRSVGTSSPASRWAEGRNRWAIWWLAGTRQGLFCVFVCVCSTNRLGHVVLGDHLSCGCSSSLSCVISSTILALPDIGLCWEISYSSSVHFLLPYIKGISSVQKKTLCVLVININLSIFSPHIVTCRFLCSQMMVTLATFLPAPHLCFLALRSISFCDLCHWQQRTACSHVQTLLAACDSAPQAVNCSSGSLYCFHEKFSGWHSEKVLVSLRDGLECLSVQTVWDTVYTVV